MSSHSLPYQMRKRASLARVIAQVTLGIGISTFAVLSGASASAQSCDRCGGVAAPSCGCEHAKSSLLLPKPCNCQCDPKPSLGEKLLSHLDRMGDRIEAKAQSSRATRKCQCDQHQSHVRLSRAATCGCEPSEPSCGCEFHPHATPSVEPPISFSYQQPPLPFSSSNSLAPSSRGTLSDKATTNTVSPRTTVPHSMASPKQEMMPSKPMNEPQVQRVPFEQRKPVPNPNHSRIPADTVTPPPPSQNNLKQPPLDPPPALNPRQTAPSTKPVPPTEQNLPDVLVDPFKDDASLRKSRGEPDGIQLSSSKSSSRNSMYLVPGRKQLQDKDASAAVPETPASLTPAQRQTTTLTNTSGLEFEAIDPETNEASHVVRSSYTELAPVKVNRKSMPGVEPSDAPKVPKVKVPQKR